MDTIPWGLLKASTTSCGSNKPFQWILFLRAYLKLKHFKETREHKFQWILFLRAYLKTPNWVDKEYDQVFQWILFLRAYLKKKGGGSAVAYAVSVDTIP